MPLVLETRAEDGSVVCARSIALPKKRSVSLNDALGLPGHTGFGSVHIPNTLEKDTGRFLGVKIMVDDVDNLHDCFVRHSMLLSTSTSSSSASRASLVDEPMSSSVSRIQNRQRLEMAASMNLDDTSSRGLWPLDTSSSCVCSGGVMAPCEVLSNAMSSDPVSF